MRDFEPVAYADGLVYALSNGGPRYPSVPRGPLTYATPATTPRLAAVADAAVPDDRRGRRPGRTGQPQTFQEPSPPRVRKAGHRAAAEVHDIEEHQVRGHPRGPVHRPGGGLASPMRCGAAPSRCGPGRRARRSRRPAPPGGHCLRRGGKTSAMPPLLFPFRGVLSDRYRSGSTRRLGCRCCRGGGSGRGCVCRPVRGGPRSSGRP